MPPEADVDWAVLALDLGGTQVRAAVVRGDGTVVTQRRTRTPVEDGGEAIVQACLDTLVACRDAYAGTALPIELVGIGIAAPGPVDPVLGLVIDPPNLGPVVPRHATGGACERAARIARLPRPGYAGGGPG